MPERSTDNRPQSSRVIARTSTLLGLVALAIAGCTTPDTKTSDAAPLSAKPAPLEPPPTLSAAPAAGSGQAEAARNDTAQAAPTLPPATIETPSGASPSEATQSAPPETAAAPQPVAPVPSAGAAAPAAAATESAFEDPPPDTGWPRILSGNGQTFTVYQPQLDSWDGFTLEAHAAVAVETGGEQPPIFGVVNLSAHTLVDKDERLVTLEDLKVSDARFPFRARASASVWAGAARRSAQGHQIRFARPPGSPAGHPAGAHQGEGGSRSRMLRRASSSCSNRRCSCTSMVSRSMFRSKGRISRAS